MFSNWKSFHDLFSKLYHRDTMVNFLKYFSLLLFAVALLVTPAAAADYSGDHFRITYQPENLGVGGGVNDSYNTVTLQAKTDDVKTLRVTFDLPHGVSYVAGTVEITDNNGSGDANGNYTISEYDISNPNQPVFEILNTSNDEPWGTGDYVAFRFKRTANCAAVDYSMNGGVFKDYAALTYDRNGATITDADEDPNTGSYSLLYASLSLEDIMPVSGNVGETFSREVKVINGGNAGASVVTHEVWPGAGVTDYKLYYNGTVLTPSVDPNDGHLIYTIDMAASPFSAGNGNYEDGDGVLEDGETLVFTEAFRIMACGDDAAIYHQASWECQSTEKKAGTVLVDAGDPNLKITVEEGSQNVCGVNHYKIIIENTATNPEDWARDILLDLGLGYNADLLDMGYDNNNRWAFDCRGQREVSNFTINGQSVTMDQWDADWYTNCGSDFTPAILPNLHDVDIDGAGGLSDIDGDGYFDDLAAGESIVFEFDYWFDPAEGCGAGRFPYIEWEHLYFNALDKNQCGTPEVNGIDLGYGAMIRNYGGSTVVEADSDVKDGEEFEVAIAPQMIAEGSLRLNDQAVLSDRDDSEFTITITVPDGVDLSPNAGPEYTQVGNEITWSTTDLQSRYVLGSDGFSDMFAAFPLQLDCAEYTAANNGQSPPIIIDYKTHLTLNNVDGDACLERDIHCGQFPPIVAHCPAVCAGPSTTKFDAHRITPGWTDETMSQQVDLSQAETEGYNLDYYMAGDEMQIDVEGEMGTLIADNLHFVFTYVADGGADDLQWVSGKVHYYDASAGRETDAVDLAPPTVTSSSGTNSVQFDLPLDDLGGQVTQGDKFYLELHYKISKDISIGTVHELSDFRGHFYVVDPYTDEEVSCDSWGDTATYFKVGVSSSLYIIEPFSSCERRLLNIVMSVNSPVADAFPNEFRPPFKWNYTRMQFPEGIDLVDARYQQLNLSYRWSNGDLKVTDEGNGVYLVEPSPNVSIPLVDQRSLWRAHLYLTITGSCSAQEDNTITLLEGSVEQYVYLPGEEEEVLNANSRNVTYTKPTYIIQPATAATLVGNEPYADFDVRVQNTSPVAIPYHWIYMPGVQGVDVEVIQDITDPANPVDLAFQEAADGSLWVEIGDLDAGEIKTIRFHATYSVCDDTPVDFYLGFSCRAYPANLTEASSCEPLSTRITLMPSQAEIQLQVLEEPDTNISSCTEFEMKYEVNSAQPGTVVDPYLLVDIPGGTNALQFNQVLIEYPRGSGNEEDITNLITVVDAHTIAVPITHSGLAPYGGLPGTGVVGADPDARKAILTFKVQTTCDFPSNSALRYTTKGSRTCTDPAIGDGTTITGTNIIIAGLTPTYDIFSTIAIDDEELLICSQEEDKTVTVDSRVKDIPGDNVIGMTGSEDYSKVTLPAGVEYVDGSFQSTGANAVTLEDSGSNYLLVKYPAGLGDDATTQYKFKVRPASNAECADDVEIFVENYTKRVSSCGNEICSEATLRTGTARQTVDLLKPILACNDTGQASVSQSGLGGEYILHMTLSNASTNPDAEFPTPNEYKVYCADANGQPTGDALYTGSTPALAPGTSEDIDLHFTSSTVCSAEHGLVVVWAKDANCVCNDTACAVPLLAAQKTLVDTNQDFTAGSDVAIGEIVTYETTLEIPSGATLEGVTLTDTMAQGLAFVACETITGDGLTDGQGNALDLAGICDNPVVSEEPAGSSESVDQGRRVVWNFGTVHNNSVEIATLTVRYQAVVLDSSGNQNGTSLENSAQWQWTGVETLPATVLVDVAVPELSITKRANPTAVATADDEVTFTLEIQHTANSAAHAYDVVVTDVLPADLEYVTNSLTAVSGPAPTSMAYDDATRTITITWDEFSLGASAQIQFKATFTGTTQTTATNAATVAWSTLPGDVTDPQSDYNDLSHERKDTTAGDVTVTFEPLADLELSKVVYPEHAGPGAIVTFTLTLTNKGPSPATHVNVSDSVPDGYTYIAGSIGSEAGSSGASITADDSNAPTLTWSVDRLEKNDEVKLTFEAEVNPVGERTNTAEVISSDQTDPDSTPADGNGDDYAEAAIIYEPEADLSITKDDGQTLASPGGTVVYTIVVRNHGPNDALGAVVKDTKPTAITSWTWKCTDATGGASGCDGVTDSTRDFSDILSLPANSSITYTVTAHVATGASGLVDNQVEVTPPDGTMDPIPDNNRATDVDTLSIVAKRMTDTNQDFTGGADVAIGEVVTYEVTLNIPVGRVEDLTLTDVLGQGLAFVTCESINADGGSLTSSKGSLDTICDNAVVSEEPAGSREAMDQGRKVTWDFGTLENSGPGEAILTVTYQVVVLDSAGNQNGTALSNAATWTWAGGKAEAEAPQITILEPQLEITKTATPTAVLPDDVVTFTLEIQHTGESTTNAYDVEMRDALPMGLTYVDGSLRLISGPAPVEMTYDVATHTINVKWDEFDLGAQAILQFKAQLNANTNGSVLNEAFVAWTSLPCDPCYPGKPGYTPFSDYNTLSHERAYDPGSGVDVYGASATAVVEIKLPETGFTPGVSTALPTQEVNYSATTMRLVIPKLGVDIPIVGVPRDGENGWDLTWLWNQAGWLDGTAYPTWPGNTAITAHVYLPNGKPGPFVDLRRLTWGDRIEIQTLEERYVYEVRKMRLVEPEDLSVLRHRDLDWLTLITCQGYDEETNMYRWRLVVQAVLVEVLPRH